MEILYNANDAEYKSFLRFFRELNDGFTNRTSNSITRAAVSFITHVAESPGIERLKNLPSVNCSR